MGLWNRKLPTGEDLEKEAARLGVSLNQSNETWNSQQRVLAARTARSNALLNWAQTVGIIGTLAITVVFSTCNRRAQVNTTSGDFMLRFDEKLNAGQSGMVAKALDNGSSLTSDQNISDDDIDAFLSNYELLADVYRHDLINRDMAYDAFSYDLEKALKDPRVKQYLVKSRREEPDLFDGVLELSRAWGIKADLTVAATPTSQPSPMSPTSPSATH